MEFLLKNKAKLTKPTIYLIAYILIILLYPLATAKLYGYEINSQDPYLYYIPIAILISFTYLKWGEISQTKKSKLQTLMFSLLTLVILAIPLTKIFTVNESSANAIQEYQTLIVFYGAQMTLSYVFLYIAIFGWNFIKKFKAEHFIITLGLFLYSLTQILVELAWSKFSLIITYSLSYILPLFTTQTYVDIKTFNIRLLDFNAYIGPPCAGIFSIITFAFLFITTLVFIRKNQKIDPFKSFMALLIGLIITFILNIVRITIIILVGGFYSEKLAVNLFHEYLSAIFLIALFMAYLYWVIPKLIERPRH